jgi:hypothetical protein
MSIKTTPMMAMTPWSMMVFGQSVKAAGTSVLKAMDQDDRFSNEKSAKN